MIDKPFSHLNAPLATGDTVIYSGPENPDLTKAWQLSPVVGQHLDLVDHDAYTGCWMVAIPGFGLAAWLPAQDLKRVAGGEP